MTLQEALQTGKAFRRTGYDFAVDIAEFGPLENEDILATDWEVEDETYELSDEDIAAAWNTARAGFPSVKKAGESPFYQAFLIAIKRISNV